MNKKLLKSIVSLVAVLALGVGVTYALFTSNTVTISNNTLTTGEATIKLCNRDGTNNWKNSISPGLILTDMVPGVEEELTDDTHRIYLGNDGGNLSALWGGVCDSYGDPAGSSDVPMRMVPKVMNVNCFGDSILKDQLKLRFTFSGGDDTGLGTLTYWMGNVAPYGPTFAVDAGYRIRMYSELDPSATLQNKTCTFDVDFTGVQVP